MKKNKKDIIICILLMLIFLIFTLLVKFFDVKNIGPNNSSVGFSTLNSFISKKIGVNILFYKFTDILGFIPIIIAFIYGLKGIVQLIKRKNLFKVDFEILILGVFYVLAIIIYVFFEVVIINYRPALIDNVLEASYPSSHTILSIFILLSSVIVNKYLIKDKIIRKKISIFLIITMILILLGRILSGVHWFTDIVGGMLISLFLLKSFDTTLKIKNNL